MLEKIKNKLFAKPKQDNPMIARRIKKLSHFELRHLSVKM